MKRSPAMKIRKKILDFEYEEVLDTRTRELIRVGCAVAVGCPT
jgi:alkylhydroperoxidase/carboxymuconolactone decarboxylase family protein YurZ